MPLAGRKADPLPPIDPADWRPQAFGRNGFRTTADPVIEPNWSGVRVIARIGPGPGGSPTVTLTDEDGLDATQEFADLARTIASAALADELVLDGYLTVEPTQATVGVPMTVMEIPTKGQVMTQFIAGSSIRRNEPERRLDSERPIAFVAVDLLLIDGSSLIDLPLLERKRLLDTALKVGELVRITPYVRPPIGSLALAWHSQGFRELAYKPANGHYLPTGKPSDWAVAPIRRR
jgi:bifunctional non-homologous end joining protein LigD